MTSAAEEKGRRRKVIALVAGLDLLTRNMAAEMGVDLDKHDLWVAAERAAGIIDDSQWEQLAAKLDIRPPSQDTIMATREALAQRVMIVHRWDHLNHGNDVRCGW